MEARSNRHVGRPYRAQNISGLEPREGIFPTQGGRRGERTGPATRTRSQTGTLMGNALYPGVVDTEIHAAAVDTQASPLLSLEVLA